MESNSPKFFVAELQTSYDDQPHFGVFSFGPYNTSPDKGEPVIRATKIRRQEADDLCFIYNIAWSKATQAELDAVQRGEITWHLLSHAAAERA